MVSGQGGTAVADVIFGKYNPSGRLPMTFYEKTSDLPDFGDYHMANRTYRYFTGKALYSFGFGLSYTTFMYDAATYTETGTGTSKIIHLTVPVTNTGTMDGDEVVQIYPHHLDPKVAQPERSLVDYKRITIIKGQTMNVTFDIPVERFRYWNIETSTYVVDPGNYELHIGAASDDIRQIATLSVTSGIDDANVDAPFIVAPNHTKDSIKLMNEVSKIELYNIGGQMLKTVNGYEMSLSDFCKGVYLLRVFKGDKTYNASIIKE